MVTIMIVITLIVGGLHIYIYLYISLVGFDETKVKSLNYKPL